MVRVPIASVGLDRGPGAADRHRRRGCERNARPASSRRAPRRGGGSPASRSAIHAITRRLRPSPPPPPPPGGGHRHRGAGGFLPGSSGSEYPESPCRGPCFALQRGLGRGQGHAIVTADRVRPNRPHRIEVPVDEPGRSVARRGRVPLLRRQADGRERCAAGGRHVRARDLRISGSGLAPMCTYPGICRSTTRRATRGRRSRARSASPQEGPLAGSGMRRPLAVRVASPDPGRVISGLPAPP